MKDYNATKIFPLTTTPLFVSKVDVATDTCSTSECAAGTWLTKLMLDFTLASSYYENMTYQEIPRVAVLPAQLIGRELPGKQHSQLMHLKLDYLR